MLSWLLNLIRDAEDMDLGGDPAPGVPDTEYSVQRRNPDEPFHFRGRLYDGREWMMTYDTWDSPPMHDMGPGWVWIPDGLRVEKRR